VKKIKILIIGKNSFIGSNLYILLKKKYLIDILSFKSLILREVNKYDYIINCSTNIKYINYKYDEKNDFDFKIIKKIKGTKTKFIFLSSRKVYQPAPNIRENSKIKCANNYEKNKYITEKKIIKFHKKNSIILRISNLIGFKKNNLRKIHSTYVDYLLRIIKKGRIIENEKQFKDFLDINNFSKIINLIIKNKIFGTYNVSIGEKIYLNEINHWLLHYYKNKKQLKVIMKNDLKKNESFFLNNSKLLKKINLKLNKEKLKKECLKLSKKLFN
jgi:nucleoside-diphosphate-sugar epimerase